MRNLFGPCTLLLAFTSFASASLSAQAATTSSALMVQQPVSQNCPVSLYANRPSGAVIARAANSKHLEGTPLHISFKPTDAHGVTQADLILHGLSGTHIVPASIHKGANSIENFSVVPARAADHHFDTTVYLHKLTAIDYLEVSSITFADGTVWHSSSTSTCRVSPDGYTLVAAGK